jgi:hypothetical protein
MESISPAGEDVNDYRRARDVNQDRSIAAPSTLPRSRKFRFVAVIARCLIVYD